MFKEYKAPVTIGSMAMLYAKAQNKFMFMNWLALLKNFMKADIL